MKTKSKSKRTDSPQRDMPPLAEQLAAAHRIHPRGTVSGGGQDHAGVLHPGRHEVSRSGPRRHA